MWERSESNWNRQIVPCRPFIREAHSLPSETRSRNWIPLQCKVSFICQIEHILSPPQKAEGKIQTCDFCIMNSGLRGSPLPPSVMSGIDPQTSECVLCILETFVWRTTWTSFLVGKLKSGRFFTFEGFFAFFLREVVVLEQNVCCWTDGKTIYPYFYVYI